MKDPQYLTFRSAKYITDTLVEGMIHAFKECPDAQNKSFEQIAEWAGQNVLITERKEEGKPEAQPGTIGVRFSKNVVLLESFLIQRKIPYAKDKLQRTPMGYGVIIDHDKGETTEQALERIKP